MDLFPLLTLPPETLQKLLDRFRVVELFQLSQCSRKALSVVKTYSSSLDEAPFRLWITTGTTNEVSVRRFDYSSTLEFTFYGERSPNRLYLQFPKTYDFDGQLIDFCKEEGYSEWSRFVCATPNSAVDFFKFSHHFETLFSTNLTRLTITPGENSLKESLKSEWLLKRNSMWITIERGRVTHEEMAHVLDFFDGFKSLQLNCSPGQYFSYDKTISTRYLTVSEATWIKRHNLLKLDSDNVDIRGCYIENEDLNAFLSHWLQSGDKKLKTMRIDRNHYSSEEEKKNAYKFVQEEVLKGLPTIPGAPKRHDAIGALPYLHPNTPFEAGMDLRRESDGVLATVVVREEDYYGVTFTFAVWQVADPNVVVVVP